MRRYTTPAAEASYLLPTSPVVFTARIVGTRLLKQATESEEAIFEDHYDVVEAIKGEPPNPAILRIGGIGDGDETPSNETAYAEYIASRAGRKIIVLTRRHEENGSPVLIAVGDCPYLPEADSVDGQALVAAMKDEVQRTLGSKPKPK